MENVNIPFVQKHILLQLSAQLSAVSLAYREITSQYDMRIVSKRIVLRYDFSESLQLYRL